MGWTLYVDRGDLADVVPLGDGSGYGLPRMFTASVEPGDEPGVVLEFEVKNGAPECTAVRMEASEGGGIRSRHLRMLRIDDVLEAVVAKVAVPLVDTGSGKLAFKLGIDLDEVGTVVTQTRTARRKTSRARPSDAELRRVADTYQRARASGRRDTTAAVQEALGIAHRTASLYLAKARERIDPRTGTTFLPPKGADR